MSKKAIVSLLVLAMVAVACGGSTDDAAEEVVEEVAMTTLEEVQASGFLMCCVCTGATGFTEAVDD